MSDTYTSNDEDVTIKFGLIVDKESFKEAQKTGDNLIGLIADLAIIGKVAANALGSMWSGMQKTVDAGLKEFDDINLGLTVGVDAEDLARLQHAVGVIGGDNKDVNSILKSLDAKRLSFTDTQTGEKELVDLITEMATFGVPEGEGEALKKALEDNKLIDAVKLFGDMREDLGENFSNFADRLGLAGLANLELGDQYDRWLKAWNDSSLLIIDVNTKGLGDLQEGYATMATTLREASKYLGGVMGEGTLELSNAMMEGTKYLISWFDEFREKPLVKGLIGDLREDLLTFLSGDKMLLEIMADRVMTNAGLLKDVVDPNSVSNNMTPGGFYIPTADQTDKPSGIQSDGSFDPSAFKTLTVENMNVTTADVESFINYDLGDELPGWGF